MRASAVLLALLFSAFFLSFVYGEQTGTLNLTTANSTYGSGFVGNTISYCNTTDQCLDSTNYRCLVDYDSESINSSFTGWCAPASQTSCAHNNAAAAGYENTTTGSKYCVNSTAYRTCTSGNWSGNATLCASGETCQDGACKASSSGSSSASNATGANASFITIVAYPSSFSATQGDNVSRTVNVTNGNTTQKNITLSVAGISASWFAVSPGVISVLGAKNNGSFTVTFSIPPDAAISQYTVSIVATTSNASVNHTVSFTLTVLPSNQTVEQQLRPELAGYETQLSELDARLAAEKANFSEAKRTKIENLIAFAKMKLESAKTLLSQGNYTQLTSELQELKDLTASINSAFAEQEQPPAGQPQDLTLLLALVVILAIAAAFIAYMMWPAKQAGYSKETGWLHPEQKKKLFSLKGRFRKKKKQEESYFYGTESKQG